LGEIDLGERMNRFAAAVLGGGLAATPLAAQTPPSTYTVAPTGAAMPGTPVGTAMVAPAGSPIPKAVPAAGAKVGTGPTGIPNPLDPRAPQGQMVDLKNVVAPYPGMPSPEPSFWERLNQRWDALFGATPPVAQPTHWNPGIGRRNRERKEERMWRKD